MIRNEHILYLAIIFFFFNGTTFCDYSPYRDKSKQILVYKVEIEKLNNRITDYDYYINHYTQKLNEFEQRIKFLSEILGETKSGINSDVNSIGDEIELIKQKEKINKLKEEFKKRILWLYKYGADYNTQLLFTAGSMNEFYARLQYLNKLSQLRKKDFERIRFEEYTLLEKKKIRKLTQREYESYVKIKKSDQEILINEKYAIEDSLRAFKFRKELLQRQITKFNYHITELENILSYIDSGAYYSLNNNPDYLSEDFPALKGRLILPVLSVDVISDYGKSVSHESRTITFNNGVDVSIAKGSEVKSVASGVVEKIINIPHYGKTLIINHGNDFRTVYSILSDILIREGDIISTGQVIAKTGYNFNGQSFHFELWDKNNTLDPKQWVRKGRLLYR